MSADLYSYPSYLELEAHACLTLPYFAKLCHTQNDFGKDY